MFFLRKYLEKRKNGLNQVESAAICSKPVKLILTITFEEEMNPDLMVDLLWSSARSDDQRLYTKGILLRNLLVL